MELLWFSQCDCNQACYCRHLFFHLFVIHYMSCFCFSYYKHCLDHCAQNDEFRCKKTIPNKYIISHKIIADVWSFKGANMFFCSLAWTLSLSCLSALCLGQAFYRWSPLLHKYPTSTSPFMTQCSASNSCRSSFEVQLVGVKSILIRVFSFKAPFHFTCGFHGKSIYLSCQQLGKAHRSYIIFIQCSSLWNEVCFLQSLCWRGREKLSFRFTWLFLHSPLSIFIIPRHRSWNKGERSSQVELFLWQSLSEEYSVNRNMIR